LKYSVQDVIDIHEEERAYQEYVAECYDEEQHTVCGKD
jgi:cupin superfamily acireductone dioxygenase involved in methionine salvage